MKKKRTTPAKNIVDRREEGPCTHGKLKDELRRSARKRRREERAKRREDSRERKRWSKASSPHCGIRPENTVALSHKAKGSIDGEGDAKLNEGGKVGVSKENTPAEIGTVRIDDMTEEAVTGHTSPPHKKEKKAYRYQTDEETKNDELALRSRV